MSFLRTAILLVVTWIMAWPNPSTAGPRRRAPQWIEGELLVGMKSGVDASSLRSPAELQGGVVAAALHRPDIRLLRVPAQQLEEIKQQLAGDPRVAFVERNRLLPPAVVPDDPVISYHIDLVGLPDAWETTRGNPNLVIAILDSGIDPDHPDLAGKLVPGYNFWDDNEETADLFGHGTQVAGIAAAATNNGTGVAGAAWDCGLIPLRVTNDSGFGSLFAIAQALTWGVDHGARLFNLSFEGIHSSASLDAALSYVRGQGGITVASAGNNGSYDSTPDQTDVISVAATDSTDTNPAWSSYGPYVDLAAPGASVRTTNNGGGTATASGTSFSSPLVAGIAALVWSAAPDLTPAEVQEILTSTAVDLGDAGRDDHYGSGRIDAAAAVAAAVAGNGPPPDTTPPAIDITAPALGATLSGQVTVDVVAVDASGVSRVELYVDGVLIATDKATPYTYLWDTEGYANGDHTLTATAVDTVGNSASHGPITVTVDNLVIPTPVLSNLSALVASPKSRLVLTGSGFDLAFTTVTIGGKYTPIVAISSTEITVKVPRLPKYTVAEVVVNNDGESTAGLFLEIR